VEFVNRGIEEESEKGELTSEQKHFIERFEGFAYINKRG